MSATRADEADGAAVPAVPSARRQALIGVAALVVLCLAVFGTAIVNSVHAVVDPAWRAVPLRTWSDRAAALEGDAFFAALAAFAVLRWVPRWAPDLAARLRPAPLPAGRLPGRPAAAVCAYLGIAIGSGWVGGRLAGALHLPQRAAPGFGRAAAGLVMGTAAAAAAAVTEELVLMALTVAVLEQWWAARGGRPRGATAATIALLVALRWLLHLYYLGGSLFVLLWIPAAYLLYRHAGSIRPLVVGHAAYDLVLGIESAYPAGAAVLDRVLWWLGAAGLGALAAGLLRRPGAVPEGAGPLRPGRAD